MRGASILGCLAGFWMKIKVFLSKPRNLAQTSQGPDFEPLGKHAGTSGRGYRRAEAPPPECGCGCVQVQLRVDQPSRLSRELPALRARLGIRADLSKHFEPMRARRRAPGKAASLMLLLCSFFFLLSSASSSSGILFCPNKQVEGGNAGFFSLVQHLLSKVLQTAFCRRPAGCWSKRGRGRDNLSFRSSLWGLCWRV